MATPAEDVVIGVVASWPVLLGMSACVVELSTSIYSLISQDWVMGV